MYRGRPLLFLIAFFPHALATVHSFPSEHATTKLPARMSSPHHAPPHSAASLAGFSLELVASDPEGLGHAVVHRGRDGFLHLQSLHTNLDGANSSVANDTATATPQPDMYAPLRLPSSVVVIVGTGHAQQSYLFKVNPSSNMIWMQCVGCNPHSPQRYRLFDFSESPTFYNVMGSDPYCRPPFQSELSGQACSFKITGPGSLSVKGYLGHDQFIYGEKVHRNVPFGCAYKAEHFQNDGLFTGVIGPAAMARGLTQFSYCLFAGGEASRRGFLRFGSDVPRNLGYKSTRILPALDAHDSGHYVSLVGVSVGTHRLNGIRPEMFARREDGHGGCVIDLGTTLTVMSQEAYEAGALRVKRPGYGLCVRASEPVMGRRLPSMSLHFAEEEAVLAVSPEQLFLKVDDEHGWVVCLAVKPGRRTVIGALQQVDTRFVFNLKDSKFSFAPESCILDSIEAA
ncbi:hypothetical protein HU200_005592 [Digitaria exilis]|uniref:Peptidase A1 domain-containing protein n=1 Tax=Digitaria exilis TaxID=1010633 RepID=A0A835FU71_9POAL|nr:hypothetical protein HU200_005592 [Digitaria exilis]